MILHNSICIILLFKKVHIFIEIEMRFSLLRQGLRPGVQSNHHVMGIATIKNHPFENNYLKEQLQTWQFIPRTFRRFNESWFKWALVPTTYYIVMDYIESRNALDEKKNPKDFENDE
jgi:hypothetical protein